MLPSKSLVIIFNEGKEDFFFFQLQLILLMVIKAYFRLTNSNKKGVSLVHSDDAMYPGQMVQGIVKENQVHWGVAVIILL